MAGENGRADGHVDTGLFRLPHLPEEIRLNVFESLVPDSLRIGTSPPLSPDIEDSRAALLNLCRTDKKCYALVMPLLYKHVIITDYVQMASLLVSLIFYNDRRAWIRSLAVLEEFQLEGYDEKTRDCNYEFMSETISWLKTYDIQNREPRVLEIFDAVGAVLTQLKDLISGAPVVYEDSPDPDCDDSLNDFPWRGYERKFNDVNGRLFELLLQVEINIKDILVTIPPGFAHCLCPADLHHRIMGQFRLDPTQPASENPLGNLRSIRKQAGSRSSDRLQPYPLAPEYLRSKDWEFFRDDGTWFFNDFLDDQGWPRPIQAPRYLMVFSHITDLGLYESLTHPAQLRVILRSCRSLKALCYTTNATEWTDRFQHLASTEEEDEIAVPTLQEALDEVGETLTDLRLGWAPWGAVLTQEEEAAVAPHRVDVSLFAHLTSFDIDLAFVH